MQVIQKYPVLDVHSDCHQLIDLHAKSCHLTVKNISTRHGAETLADNICRQDSRYSQPQKLIFHTNVVSCKLAMMSCHEVLHAGVSQQHDSI